MSRFNIQAYRLVGLAIVSLILFGCGGGGGSSPPAPPVLSSDASLSAMSVTGATFAPAFSSGVTSYTAAVPFGSNSVDVSATVSNGNANITINGGNSASVTLAIGDNTISIVVTAENGTTTNTYTVVVTRLNLAQDAYIKASNTNGADEFGVDVALSADGNTLAVGAVSEDSSTNGVNGDETDNSAIDSGAVYVFTRDNSGVWIQQAYIKASNTDTIDRFGSSLALSGDGVTLAVGAWGEGSIATGINGDQTDTSANAAGAVYVYTRDNGGVWTQQAYVKASNTDASGDFFGFDVALSTDGDTLAVGAVFEDSAATGVNGNQTDNSAFNAGAAYVFTRDGGGVWTQQAYVKASNTDSDDAFASSLALSGDGDTLAVSSVTEDSSATGVNGNQTDNSANAAGAVYVYTRDTGGVWTQQAYVKASNTDSDDGFASGLALSGDGDTLAVGSGNEDSSATGVNGDQMDNSANAAGAVYVYTRNTGDVWTQQAYVKASNTGADDLFGVDVAVSTDGDTLAVAATLEDGPAGEINTGAVYVFIRGSGGVWTQQAYVKASNTGSDDWFGQSVTLSGDGGTLAMGSPNEDSSAAGVNGDQTDNSDTDAGAAYVLR